MGFLENQRNVEDYKKFKQWYQRKKRTLNILLQITQVTKELNCFATCNERKKEGYFEKFWNGVHSEEEEKEDFEIRGCNKEQLE